MIKRVLKIGFIISCYILTGAFPSLFLYKNYLIQNNDFIGNLIVYIIIIIPLTAFVMFIILFGIYCLISYIIYYIWRYRIISSSRNQID